MLKNYIKVAVRNLLRYKVYSVMNIVGLALGMTCTILLALFVQHELSYDNYFPEVDKMYRVAAEFKMAGQESDFATSPPILAQIVKEEIPGIEKTVRFRVRGSQIIKHNEISFNESRICYVDNSVIDVFALDLINGDRENPLVEPNSIIISNKIAEKYFGEINPIGKTITLNNNLDCKVTGVYKEIPQNTHFIFDFMISMPTLKESEQVNWLSNNFQTYLIINSGIKPEFVEKRLNELLEKYMGPELEQAMGITIAQLKEKGDGAAYYLQKVENIHLHSDIGAELGVNSDIKYVYIFSIIALFILIIACVNFINISTARSSTRAKEVGIRKVLGSYKKGLVRQFITESFITTIISLIVAMGLIEILMPYFNNLTGKQLVMEYFNNQFILFFLVAILVVIGFLAGSYPAFVLSSYSPVQALSGKAKIGTRSGGLRSGLVVFQFTASIIMIISTIVVINQLDYIQNKKLGYNKENVITLNFTYLLGDQVQTFKQKMLQNSEISNASVSGFLPVPSGFNQSMIWPGSSSEDGVSVQTWDVDHDYIPTMGMKIVKGRDFSREFSTDSTAVILNQAAVKLFNLENPIGTKITRPISLQGDVMVYEIIGVVEDFHYQSLRNNIGPLAMFSGDNNGIIAFRTNTADVSSVITKLKETWNEMAPGQPFNYSFLDERFNNMYNAEQRISEIFGTFAIFAIFIGCLGLFSLSAFTAEQKTKEIGIRKILGSSIMSIVYMLSREFIKLVGIAIVIASPIAYYFMTNWLNDFEYRTDISVTIFIVAGLISIAIAVLTVSYHALKAASANPVESLRNE